MQTKAKTATKTATKTESRAVATTAAEKPAISENAIGKLFNMLHSCESIPVKIGGNRGRNSSEPLGGEHPRVGFGPRGAAMLHFLAIASGVEIKPGNIIPRFVTIGETELHGETGCGRNVLRGRKNKKTGKTAHVATLAETDSGDGFKLTADCVSELALIPAGAIKAFRAELATYL